MENRIKTFSVESKIFTWRKNFAPKRTLAKFNTMSLCKGVMSRRCCTNNLSFTNKSSCCARQMNWRKVLRKNCLQKTSCFGANWELLTLLVPVIAMQCHCKRSRHGKLSKNPRILMANRRLWRKYHRSIVPELYRCDYIVNSIWMALRCRCCCWLASPQWRHPYRPHGASLVPSAFDIIPTHLFSCCDFHEIYLSFDQHLFRNWLNSLMLIEYIQYAMFNQCFPFIGLCTIIWWMQLCDSVLFQMLLLV